MGSKRDMGMKGRKKIQQVFCCSAKGETGVLGL